MLRKRVAEPANGVSVHFQSFYLVCSQEGQGAPASGPHMEPLRWALWFPVLRRTSQVAVPWPGRTLQPLVRGWDVPTECVRTGGLGGTARLLACLPLSCCDPIREVAKSWVAKKRTSDREEDVTGGLGIRGTALGCLVLAPSGSRRCHL